MAGANESLLVPSVDRRDEADHLNAALRQAVDDDAEELHAPRVVLKAARLRVIIARDGDEASSLAGDAKALRLVDWWFAGGIGGKGLDRAVEGRHRQGCAQPGHRRRCTGERREPIRALCL